MNAYVNVVAALIKEFKTVAFDHVSRDLNSHADALAGLGAVCADSKGIRTIDLGEVPRPSFRAPLRPLGGVMVLQLGPSWMDPIVAYLTSETLPSDRKEAHRVRCQSSSYFLDPSGVLYRRSFTGPDLRVIHEQEVPGVLQELHDGSSGCHCGGRSLAHRALTQGFWWKKMKHTAEEYVKRCTSCQKHSPLLHQPTLPLQPVSSPWPFAQWGVDIVGEMPKAPGGFRYLITATDYYTKWVEAKALITITAADVESFLWKHIICRFGVPFAIVSDNGTQFVAEAIKALYAKHKILMKTATVSYPQGNGQAEASNKSITAGLKRRLDNKRGKWAQELSSVLWGYRTTPRRGTGRTPYSMAFGVEAVLPSSATMLQDRMASFDVPSNTELLATAADHVEDLRDEAHVRYTAYQQQLARSYNKNVRARPFNVDDLVLRQVVQKSKLKKLMPKWDGPFRIIKKVGYGAYDIATMDGTREPNSWNAQRLRKFYG